MKRRVAASQPLTAEAMERAAARAWVQLTSDKGYVGKLYGSMPRRLQMVVEAKGGFVPY